MISPERLSEIKTRHQKATPGPWWVSARRTDGAATIGPVDPSPTRAPFVVREILIDDAAFVAGSRQDVPDLVEEVERLQKALAEHEGDPRRPHAGKTIRIRLVKQRDGLMLVDKVGPEGKDLCELLTLYPSEAEDLRLALEWARKAKPGAYVCASAGRVEIDGVPYEHRDTRRAGT